LNLDPTCRIFIVQLWAQLQRGIIVLTLSSLRPLSRLRAATSEWLAEGFGGL